MEGDIKDIVLLRLEKRLKDKDDEIRALKDRVHRCEDADRIKALEAKVDSLQDEVSQAWTTLSEIMKKVCSIEAAIASLEAEGGCEDLSDPDLVLDGQSEPPKSKQLYDVGVAARVDPVQGAGDAAGDKKDAMRFFQMGKNA